MNSRTQGRDCAGTSEDARKQELIDKRIRTERPSDPNPKACDACLQLLKKQKCKTVNPAEHVCDCDMCRLKHLCTEHAHQKITKKIIGWNIMRMTVVHTTVQMNRFTRKEKNKQKSSAHKKKKKSRNKNKSMITQIGLRSDSRHT